MDTTTTTTAHHLGLGTTDLGADFAQETNDPTSGPPAYHRPPSALHRPGPVWYRVTVDNVATDHLDSLSAYHVVHQALEASPRLVVRVERSDGHNTESHEAFFDFSIGLVTFTEWADTTYEGSSWN